MLHIPYIIGKLLWPRHRVATIHLRPPGNAGFHLVAARLLGAVERQIFHQQRAGPHKRHVAFQNVEQLRQLVEGSFPDELPDGRETLFVGEQMAVCVALVGHGLEFHHGKNSPVPPGPGLREPDLATVGDEQHEDADQQYGQGDH